MIRHFGTTDLQKVNLDRICSPVHKNKLVEIFNCPTQCYRYGSESAWGSQIRIHVREKCRSRTRFKVKSRIRIRIRSKIQIQELWRRKMET
jgi:hypothetical protein